MTYTITVKHGDVWDLTAPDGTLLLEDQPLPVDIPSDISEPAVSHSGSYTPVATGDYEVVDER